MYHINFRIVIASGSGVRLIHQQDLLTAYRMWRMIRFINQLSYHRPAGATLH